MEMYFHPRARESRAAIEKLHINMRHLLIRGSYKPIGSSGEPLIESMLDLKPEIYGSISDPERIELTGLHYIFQRLPRGIEQCRYIRLISREGYENSEFKAIIPPKRRRNCYRIDDKQMYIEMTRGKSDIYDVLTHLTFMYIEAEKIRRNGTDIKNRPKREWLMMEETMKRILAGEEYNEHVTISYMSTLLGRTYDETQRANDLFNNTKGINSLIEIIYWLGKLSIEEETKKKDREITFSSALREYTGHHIYGEKWAYKIKEQLYITGKLKNPIHIISSNLHSVMNCIFAKEALGSAAEGKTAFELMENISQDGSLSDKIHHYALQHGMSEIHDDSGTNISVQLFDFEHIDAMDNAFGLDFSSLRESKSILFVMDYAFGEQAFETMDEFLKGFTPMVRIQEDHPTDATIKLNVRSINIMGKAGILEGIKGDIMIPHAHFFEGSADNYPFENKLDTEMFADSGLNTIEGTMITVLGTSLQNKEILRYFLESSWHGVGLEMEGAHYQKAIQAASKIRKNIRTNVDLRYAYYASDNPLESGSTLASGGLGLDGVKPTYWITWKILEGIVNS